MLVRVSYEDLSNAIALLQNVIATKGLQEDLKVMNLYVKDTNLKLIATDGKVFCLTDLNGTYDLEGLTEENSYVALRIKEISEILDKFKSLQRTTVKHIEMLIKEHGVVMIVTEEAKNDEEKSLYADQITRFKLTKMDVKSFVKQELPAIFTPSEAVELENGQLKMYLDYFETPLSKPKDPSVLHFKSDYLVSVLGNVYAIMMENKLPEIFKNFTLSYTAVSFLNELLKTTDKFKVYKEELKSDSGVSKGIILTFTFGKTIVRMKTQDMSNSVNIDNFKQVPHNQVVVDKLYLIDVLKRLDPTDQAFVSIKITNGIGEMLITSVKTNQRVPVKVANGDGVYSFVLRPEHLSNIIFSHITRQSDGTILDDVHICLHHEQGQRYIQLTCKDNTDDWSTKYPRAPIADAPTLDW